jgi:hypothetical protein
MRIIFIIVFFINSLSGFSQKQINKYLSIEKTEKGFVFATNEGRKSEEYTYIFEKSNGVFDAVIELPISDSIRKLMNNNRNRCYTDYGNVTRKSYTVFEIMKELTAIDDYIFWNGEDKWAEVKNYEGNYGFAYKNGKFAMISKKGEILTEFKYNTSSHINSYYSKKKLVSVILDKCTGEELLTTKDSIVRYWNPGNYLVKHNKNKFYLIWQSKKHKVSKDFCGVWNLPIESRIFTTSGTFINLNGKKTKTKLIPLSNIYKGYCIVKEVIKTEAKRNYYGEWIPKKDISNVMIVNEKLENVKILNGIYPVSGFNKYGLIIMEDHIGYFVMDYKGNYIIPPPKYSNRIEEVHDGLYYILDYNNIQGPEGKEQTNFYNQKGEKLVEPGWENSTLNFYESKDINYIMYHDRLIITLDKENNILSKDY